MSRRTARIALTILVAGLMAPAVTWGQSSSSDADPDDGNGGFAVRDSDVGYIDSAVIGNQIRLRIDSGYDLNRPNRAEFFYAAARPIGRGVPFPEVAVDYQQYQFYVERKANDCFSLFAEFGVRSLNPIVNDNTTGLGDMNAGCKICLLETCDRLATAQLRVYLPTGDVDSGLGTGHASIEPGLLMLQELNSQWTASAELRYWTALGGSSFAGDLVRYGIGLQYEPCGCHWFEPVVELVGWTVLDGLQSALATPGGVPMIEDASGDTIINAKLGARLSLFDANDLYIGYGHSLTGDRWYQDVFRAELRYAF